MERTKKMEDEKNDEADPFAYLAMFERRNIRPKNQNVLKYLKHGLRWLVVRLEAPNPLS